MKNGTWYNCTGQKKFWPEGEYLIERSSDGKPMIWHDNAGAATGLKSFKSCMRILESEFTSIVKIDR